MNHPPSFWAKMHIHQLRTSKTGAFADLLSKDDPKLAVQFAASNEAIDLVIEYWERLISVGNEEHIRAALDRLSEFQRKQDEDDILAQAKQIKERRAL